MSVSIIIPVLNEADDVLNMLTQLIELNPTCNTNGNQVILVDGGSTDGTYTVLASSQWTLLKSERGR